MAYIFCLIGKSAVGKDSIYKNLTEDRELKLLPYVTGTTRPIRDGETDGVEYNFCTREELDAMISAGRVIELREYQTVHGPWCYFTAEDETIDLKNNDYAIIATLESFSKLREYYGAEITVPIYIECDDSDRLIRSVQREKGSQNPKVKEICRRFLADEEDFAPEKLKAAGELNTFRNDDLNVTVDNIKAFIISKRA